MSFEKIKKFFKNKISSIPACQDGGRAEVVDAPLRPEVQPGEHRLFAETEKTHSRMLFIRLVILSYLKPFFHGFLVFIDLKTLYCILLILLESKVPVLMLTTGLMNNLISLIFSLLINQIFDEITMIKIHSFAAVQ